MFAHRKALKFNRHIGLLLLVLLMLLSFPVVFTWVNRTALGIAFIPVCYIAYHYSLVFSCVSVVVLGSVNLALVYYLGGQQQLILMNWNNFWAANIVFLLMVFVIRYINGLKKKIQQELEEKNKLQIQLKYQIQAEQKATENKDHLLMMISHDLRAPINAIIELSELIHYEKKSNKKDDYCQIINQSAHKFLDSINDLLSTGQQFIDSPFVQFDAKLLMESIIELFQPLFAKKALSLTVIFKDEMPRYYGQEKMVRQIIFNLLDNSLKNTSLGGVEVQVSALKVDEASSVLAISIADTGCGMSGASRQRIIYQVGTRDENSSAPKVGGLGLEHCLWMLNKLAGTLEIESEIGKGCTCSINIPLMIDLDTQEQQKASTSSASVTATKLTQGHHKTPETSIKHILLVEDQSDYAQAFLQKINLLGHSYAWANTASQALEMQSETVFDLVLLDLNLPDISSDMLLKKIASDHTDKLFPPIVIISADVYGENVLKWMRLGANLILNKPIALEDMKELFGYDQSSLNEPILENKAQIDRDFLNKEIQLLGFEKVSELIMLFHDTSDALLESICETFAMRKYSECARYLHKYISALSNLGLFQLAKATKQAEMECQNSQRIALSFAIYQLVCASRSIEQQLADFLLEKRD